MKNFGSTQAIKSQATHLGSQSHDCGRFRPQSTTRSHGTKLNILVSKLRSGTSKTKTGALF